MIKNYITTAFRALWKNKTYSFINIFGLSLGLATTIIIFLFVAHEYSYDKFHRNGINVYRAITKIDFDGRAIQTFSTPEFGPTVKQNNPAVLNYTRTLLIYGKVIKSDEQHSFVEDRVLFTDSSFFSVFSFALLQGNRSSLSKPGSVILTPESAAKYFGQTDVIGKTISFDKDNVLEVVGIVKKAPSNSTIQYDFIVSLSSLETMPAYRAGFSDNPAFPTYFLLRDNQNIKELENSIVKIEKANENIKFELEPLHEIHFNEKAANSGEQYVLAFLFIAILVIGLAIVNYVNLTTARGTIRAKEVGIRKVVGARQQALAIQFYLESAITTIISFLLALALIELFASNFLPLFGQTIDTTFLRSPLFIGIILLLLILCITLSGSYPALVLSGFKPIEVLRGRFSASQQGVLIRKGFTVFQFSVSVALVVSSFVIQKQLDYMRTKKLGLYKEQVMVIPLDAGIANQFYSLKNSIRGESGVLQVASASTQFFNGGYNISIVETPTTHEGVDVTTISIDENFLETLGIKWGIKPEGKLAGKYVINEEAIDRLKISESPLGHKLRLGDDHSGILEAEIAGVVKNFNYTSLHSKIQPMVMTVVSDSAKTGNGSLLNILYIKLDPIARLDEKIAAIKTIFEKYEQNIPFQYYFLDEAFNNLYKGEARLLYIFKIFTAIAIGIACLGLFGLVTFSTERKSKEIGVRKVMGASVRSIVLLISSEFIVLMLVSIALAAPLAWLMMEKWLSNFTYHIEISVWLVVMAGIISLSLALLTISIQITRAALTNPVDVLKNE